MRCVRFLLLGLFFMFSVAIAEAQDNVLSNVLSNDGVSIAYSVYGEGDVTLVLIHGWSCDSRYWNKQIPYFSKKYQVVTIDLAGHGNSGTNRKNYTMEKFGEDVAAVLRTLEAKRVILAGHSMSGGVIMQTSLIEPERVIGLIGVDTLEDIGRPWTKEQIDQVFTPIKEDFKNNTYQFVHTMFHQGADKELVETIAQDMSSANPKIAINVMKNYLSSKEYELIKKIKVPVKCVNADLWPTNEESNKLVAPEFELFLVPGNGHFLMIESPDDFNRQLDNAVKSILSLGN